MSLLDDVIDLLHHVLEYFGVPPDMLVPGWETDLCGQYRSLVRMLGSNLPLSPSPRYHFQIPLHTSQPYGQSDAMLDNHTAILSLADVLWVAEDEGNRFSRIRHCVRWSQQRGPVIRGPTPPAPGGPVPAETRARLRDTPLDHGSDPVALRKITALEDELLKLRAQIAMIVTVPVSGRLQNAIDTPGMSPVTAPVLTSTPRCLPPPPLCPPPPDTPLGPTNLGDLIRQRREAGRGRVQEMGCEAGLDGPLQSQDKTAAPLASMLDVLKDLKQVKLRSVERSPGGTPVRTQPRKAVVCASDPAAMIAEALKRKFAHRHLNSSYDKENRSAELSPFGSPDVSPRIPQHFRRSQGRLYM
ncbi:hypothetical protein DPEC_G00081210 [Dallia pectoralis]|uniref:Uncharacterized protein n=1 Tax=Dallia pectoralis TaxID=75939 RepID=A0ACC2GYN2_DALPE|nr:hypothetical protein DPEC_G00081210 [Dallia pectoralis]